MRNHIRGMAERVDQICFKTGLTKPQICKQMGFDRKALYDTSVFSVLKLARFCAVTGADANWLLGLTERRKE